MKFVKAVAVGVGAVVALGVAASSATAAPTRPASTAIKTENVVGSCATDGTGKPGTVAVKGGVANLYVPEQLSWAQVRAYPQNLKLSQLQALSFESTTTHPGVVYLKITTERGASVVFSPNTQASPEIVGPDKQYDVLASTVRLNDDAGFEADVTWADMIEVAGDAQIKDLRFTAGCANPVGDDGASVTFDNLTINKTVIDFTKSGK
jgi:hypothetical protein